MAPTMAHGLHRDERLANIGVHLAGRGQLQGKLTRMGCPLFKY